jgi:heptosyltransferase III
VKILVIQLTRLGDILCTLPTLSAIRRANPQAQIHLLVRTRFAAAAEGCPAVDHLWRFDTARLLTRFIEGSGDIGEGVGELAGLVGQLRAEKFDKIINLSFSPSSSYLTHLISGGKIPVVGYTRTSDFFLHVPDTASQYFRGQVGIDRSNRLHVADLFAWVAGVTLNESDVQISESGAKRSGIVCHLGASRKTKTWPAHSWVLLLSRLSRWSEETGREITLVGTPGELDFASNVVLQVGENPRIRNFVGQTSYRELARIIGGAELFIGCDSGPLHVAGAVGCPSLNLSVGPVRFWETGPLVRGSRVLHSADPEMLSAEMVFKHAAGFLQREPAGDHVECENRGPVRYGAGPEASVPGDHWELVKWIYFKGERPSFAGDLKTGLGQINELCEIARKQLEAFAKRPENRETLGVLDRIDELLIVIRDALVPLSPLIRDFIVQKENIPPYSREEVLFHTQACYGRLGTLALKLLDSENELEKGQAP